MKRIGLILLLFATFAVAAGDSSEAAHWTLAEMKAFENKLSQDPKTATDNPMLAILNFTKGHSVRRTSFGKSGIAEIHENGADVFCMLTGEAEFIVGGEIVDPTTTNPGEIRGPRISGGITKKVVTGDMIIIPPGTAHQIMVAPGKRISFMVAKFAR